MSWLPSGFRTSKLALILATVTAFAVATLLAAFVLAYAMLRPVAPPRDPPPEGVRVTLRAVYSDMTVLRCAGFHVLVAGGKGAQHDPVLLETADIRRPAWVERSFFFSDDGRLTAMEMGEVRPLITCFFSSVRGAA